MAFDQILKKNFWAVILVWQVVEHNRVKRAAKAALINRAKDISNTVGLVLASQRHLITKERLELALNSSITKRSGENPVSSLPTNPSASDRIAWADSRCLKV